jgi:hypothetical protein
MFKSVLTYFQNAVSLLKLHYYLALIPFSISILASFISIISHGDLSFLSMLLQLSMFGIMPMVYGRFNEVVTNNDFISWKYLFNRFFLKYVGLLLMAVLIMSIPIIILTTITIMTDIELFKVFNSVTISLSYHLLGLYIVPLIFYGNTVNESMTLGIKCLVGNIKFNLPFIIIAVFLSILSAPVHFKGMVFINYIANILRWGVVFIANLLLFIIITLVLKDKLYKPKEV